MPLQATSGAASYDAFGGGVPVVPAYIEEVFSTYLYTGNGSTQTITNGIDLSTKGGLVWYKDRTTAYEHQLVDTVRGAGYNLETPNTNAQASRPTALTAFTSTGFTLGSNAAANGSGDNFVSWTFRKQPKFFDVLTYTGDGTNNRTVAHNLTSTPGCIIVKRTDSTGTWYVYHRSTGLANFLVLNTTAAVAGAPAVWDGAPTSTTFTIQDATTNISGASYVAYLFAHDAGGFGLTGTDNVITCGSYTGNGSATGPVITLGYEPQWVMIKKTSDIGNWHMHDIMRDMSVTSNSLLWANLSDAEVAGASAKIAPLATGFQITNSTNGENESGGTYIYIAIRRGPMKVPTSGTSVFNSITRTGTGATANITGAGFPPDMIWNRNRGGGYETDVNDKLRGAKLGLFTPYTQAETDLGGSGMTIIGQDGCTVATDGSYNANGGSFVLNFWRRAPSFFDEVCYTGTGSATTVTHNLGAVPELIIVKIRDAGAGWYVYNKDLTSAGYYLLINSTAAQAFSNGLWNSTQPTSSSFTVGTGSGTNGNGSTYVAYLFATCAGVSKVGSYTGTATTLQVDCGFTGGARFVLIKRTDSTGDWYVWDTARGIVSGNDPYLLLNSTAAEVTSTDYIDTYSAGFEISSTAPAAINASGGTFIFLAIA